MLTTADLERFSVDPMLSTDPPWPRFWSWYSGPEPECPRPLLSSHWDRLGPPHLRPVLGSENRRFHVWRVTPKVIVLVNPVKGIVFNVTKNATPQEVAEAVTAYLTAMGAHNPTGGV